MHNHEGRSLILTRLGLPLLVMLGGITLQALPPRIAFLTIAWILLSLPLGIAVGHCALGEE
jgi:hypothetical protein